MGGVGGRIIGADPEKVEEKKEYKISRTGIGHSGLWRCDSTTYPGSTCTVHTLDAMLPQGPRRGPLLRPFLSHVSARSPAAASVL